MLTLIPSCLPPLPPSPSCLSLPTPPHPSPPQTTLLCQYVLNVARYDLNYDVRDRVRFLRQLLMVDGSGEDEVCVCVCVCVQVSLRGVSLYVQCCCIHKSVGCGPCSCSLCCRKGLPCRSMPRRSFSPASLLLSWSLRTKVLHVSCVTLHLEHFHLTASTFTCTEPLLYKQWRLLHHTYMCVLHCLKSIFPLPFPPLPFRDRS